MELICLSLSQQTFFHIFYLFIESLLTLLNDRMMTCSYVTMMSHIEHDVYFKFFVPLLTFGSRLSLSLTFYIYKTQDKSFFNVIK